MRPAACCLSHHVFSLDSVLCSKYKVTHAEHVVHPTLLNKYQAFVSAVPRAPSPIAAGALPPETFVFQSTNTRMQLEQQQQQQLA